MENIQQMRSIKLICNRIHERWKELCIEYGIDPGVPLVIVDPLEVIDDKLQTTINWEKFTSDSMCTIGCHIIKDSMIVGLEVGVLVNYTELLSTYIDYNLDVELTMMHLENVMRHEIGHVLHQKSFIGKSIEEWDTIVKLSSSEEENLPKIRTNTSAKSLFAYSVAYDNLPMEKAANDMVGLTHKTWATDFVFANPGYSRKKLGVDKYLTEKEFKEIRKSNKKEA